MMKTLKSKFLAICAVIFLSSCTTVAAMTPYIAPIVGTLALKLIDKNPSNLEKIEKISEAIKTAAKVADKSLTKDEFRTIVLKTDSTKDFVLFSDSLYGFYQSNTKTFNAPESLILVAEGLDQAVSIRKPSK